MTMNQDELKALTILLKASSSVEKVVKRDMSSYGLNATEFTVLELLYSKGRQPIQRIGQQVLLASSSITYVIDRLEEKTFVKRVADESDRRVTFCELTAEGEQLMKEIFPKHADKIAEIFESCTTEEVLALQSILKKIGYKAADLLK
ncbi:MarR family transcriptional regulator, 2-MHQ and catechol-resistance regulon repressor [Alkalibacterium subtropicum]|uniref:MarR family transcriptional regulator, 2-MHQ and catechol-resistance regulon repressor n=1 Tax=Alkalibacterium subtropicum TaxID=753702 RepID=A0A1I1EN86_9LACT|nr:MarR family transcriptional regulator [Alkalibacterium subtropicum]SFB88565.1 MarR family transcriptional regulator, 2-MHQ and catechol-resistance regulon repressor [Alkalibacterium subtropicum]